LNIEAQSWYWLLFESCHTSLVLGSGYSSKECIPARSWYWVPFFSNHTSLVLILSPFKKNPYQPDIGSRIDFWLVLGRFILNIDTSLKIWYNSGPYQTGTGTQLVLPQVIQAWKGPLKPVHKQDYILCAGLYTKPQLVWTLEGAWVEVLHLWKYRVGFKFIKLHLSCAIISTLTPIIVHTHKQNNNMIPNWSGWWIHPSYLASLLLGFNDIGLFLVKHWLG